MKLLSRTAILNCCIGDSGRTAWQLLCICEADPRRFSQPARRTIAARRLLRSSGHRRYPRFQFPVGAGQCAARMM
jgi:hypothetical protein